VVWGVEADIQGSGQKGSFAFVCPTGFCAPAAAVTDRLTEKLLWFGTVRGRVGFTVTPEVLAYATGGLAYGDVKRDITVNGMNGVTPVSALFSNSTTRAGWTVGAGVEGHIGGGWTAKLEYLYVDLGTFTTGRFVTPIVAPSGNFLATNFSSRVTDNIVRLGVNYKFNSSIFPKY
jgi:outer membrane immunogenic protein